MSYIRICCLFLFAFLNSIITLSQETLTLEIAPYTVFCDETESENCLQVLDLNGFETEIIPSEAIEGFNAVPGYEYTLEVSEMQDTQEGKTVYLLEKEISKLWVPQYAIDAPKLKGNFRVVGYNGKSLDPDDAEIILNAGNSVIRGSTGCNNYHLFFQQIGYSLIFSKILASHLFCAERAALEEEYFVIFNLVHHFELDGDRLRLYDITNRKLLEAERIYQ